MYFPKRLLFPDGERPKIILLWFLFSSKSYLFSNTLCSNSCAGMGSLLVVMYLYLTSSLEVLHHESYNKAAQPQWLWLLKSITNLITGFCWSGDVQETYLCATVRLKSVSSLAVKTSTSPCH